MVNVASHSTKPASTNQLQVDPTVAEFASELHPPCVFAGTTPGLYVLNSTQQLELEGNAITALAVEGTQVWAIANRLCARVACTIANGM